MRTPTMEQPRKSANHLTLATEGVLVRVMSCSSVQCLLTSNTSYRARSALSDRRLNSLVSRGSLLLRCSVSCPCVARSIMYGRAQFFHRGALPSSHLRGQMQYSAATMTKMSLLFPAARCHLLILPVMSVTICATRSQFCSRIRQTSR